MRILVTGGAGYIGSHTVKQLLAVGHTVTAYDNLSAGHKAAVPSANLVVGDLRDIDHLDHLLVVNRIEAVIHFAAHCYVGESVTHPAKYYTNNLIYTANLVDRCRKQGVNRFVFSSTCATYGVPTTVPITEDNPQNPINPYGNTKLAIEYMLADFSPAYNMATTALRYFNAAGATADGSLGEDHEPETHLIPLVLQVALGSRSHIDIFGSDYPTPDGTCVRDYVHVDDLAKAHVLAVEKSTPGQFATYNVGTGVGASVKEVVAAAEKVTGKTIATKMGPRRAGDPPVLVAKADKIREALGWVPHYKTVEPIIATAWAWHKAHPKGYAK